MKSEWLLSIICLTHFSLASCQRLFYRFMPQGDGADLEVSLSNEGETERGDEDSWPLFSRRGRGVGESSQLTSSMNSSPISVSSFILERKLTKEAQKFIDLVGVKDRRYHMRQYQRVFVGAEAVVRRHIAVPNTRCIILFNGLLISHSTLIHFFAFRTF